MDLFFYILLKEIEEEQEDVISFKLLGDKVFFELKDFDIITGLNYRSRHVVEFEQDKALKLRQLYLDDRINMNGAKSGKDYPNIKF